MITGLDHVNYAIGPTEADLKEAHHFWVGVVGLKELPRPAVTDSGRPGWWLGTPDGRQVHLTQEDTAFEHNSQSGRHAAFTVADFHTFKKRIIDAGYEVKDGRPTAKGAERIFVRDKSGNRVEFVQELKH